VSGTVDSVPGVALLNVDPHTGNAEYAGETEIWWDDQKTDRDSQGRFMLICDNGHVWPAEIQP
jgi:hypothetical protein